MERKRPLRARVFRYSRHMLVGYAVSLPQTRTPTTKSMPSPALALTSRTFTSIGPAAPTLPATNSKRPSPPPIGVAINSSSPASVDPCCTSSPSVPHSKNEASACRCSSKASTRPQPKAEPCSECCRSWQNSNESSPSPTSAMGWQPHGPVYAKVAARPSPPRSRPSTPRNARTPATTPSNRSRTCSKRHAQPSTATSTKRKHRPKTATRLATPLTFSDVFVPLLPRAPS